MRNGVILIKTRKNFRAQFPADFISEAIDQTRGWFYSLLAISSLVFDEEAGEKVDFPHPFRNCIVLGLMLSEWFESKDGTLFLTEEEAKASGGKINKVVGKMSKSKRNYPEPAQIFDKYGADALRWFFFANQAPWTSIRYSERAIKDSIPEYMLRLWNVYSFFVIYAKIDGFDPSSDCRGVAGMAGGEFLSTADRYRSVSDRSELDRWIMSELHRTIESVTIKMDAYDNYGACADLNDFVDGLSNWYVRRSRDRYWAKDKSSPDKLDAYWTLYECLLNLCKLTAPFTPFLADTLWQNLTGGFAENESSAAAVESVHLCDYPESNSVFIDSDLSEQMQLAREISSLGRSARMNAKLKVRQPLAAVEVILAGDAHLAWLESHDSLIAEELNVLEVNFSQKADEYITYHVKPNFKVLGKLLGKNMPEVKKILSESDGAVLLSQLESDGKMTITLTSGETIELSEEHVEVDISAKDGWAAAQGRGCVVVLATDLTPELIRTGMAKDLVRFIQDRRKEMDLDYTDQIHVGLVTSETELTQAVEENQAFIAGETLADSIELTELADVTGSEIPLGDPAAMLFVKKC